jgi:molybdenum cofactor cytidylyltransferase
MGCPKALLPFGGTTFLGTILDTLAAIPMPAPLVVLGRHAPLIEPHIAGRPLRILINREPERGQISSMQLALAAAGNCPACLVWPVDQPAASATLIRALIERFEESHALIVMPIKDGVRGHPAIFSSVLFREILALRPEQGAKELVRSHAGETALLETDDAGAVHDIDTPEEYRNLIESFRLRR